MNEHGLFVDYHNKEFDYYRIPVKRELYVPIPAGLRQEFCPPNGFWPCLPLVLTYRAEVFMSPDNPWASVEGTVFRTEYAALYAVAWLREFVANVDNLFALMAVEASVVWPAVSEVNRSGKRPGVYRARATSRMDVGGDFVCFNPWVGVFLSHEAWRVAVQADLPCVPDGIP
eukprot:IDg22285t1